MIDRPACAFAIDAKARNLDHSDRRRPSTGLDERLSV
jgi:hypothetical protein